MLFAGSHVAFLFTPSLGGVNITISFVPAMLDLFYSPGFSEGYAPIVCMFTFACRVFMISLGEFMSLVFCLPATGVIVSLSPAIIRFIFGVYVSRPENRKDIRQRGPNRNLEVNY